LRIRSFCSAQKRFRHNSKGTLTSSCVRVQIQPRNMHDKMQSHGENSIKITCQVCQRCGAAGHCLPRGDVLCAECLSTGLHKSIRNVLTRTKSSSPKVHVRACPVHTSRKTHRLFSLITRAFSGTHSGLLLGRWWLLGAGKADQHSARGRSWNSIQRDVLSFF
jgi:hypothetical protein